jgi:hypothetical protein
MKIILYTLLFFYSHTALSDSKWIVAADKDAYGKSSVMKELLSSVEESFKDAEIEIEIINMPIARSMVEIKSNRIDSEVARTINIIKKRKLSYINVPIHNMELCLYKLNKKEVAIEKATVVYMRGMKAIKMFNFKKKIELTSNSQAIEFFKRRHKHIDYYVGVKVYTDSYVKELKLEGMNCFKTILKTPVFHVVSKKNKHLIPKLEKSFKKFFPLKNY